MKRILGLFGWLGVVLVLAAVAVRFMYPDRAPVYQSLAIAGLVVTALYALSQWREFGRSFQGRNVKYGSVAAGGVLVFLGILVAINWIGARENKRWDLSQSKQFSLSDQTKQILHELKKPVTVKVFHDTGNDKPYHDALDGYAYESKNFNVEYIDAVKHPTEATNNQITVETVIFSYDGRTERTTSRDEQGLTNALKKVLSATAKKVYFVQGHGEHDTGDQGRAGYSALGDALKTDNFEVAKLPLAQDPKVPADATAVVIAGPKADYLPQELDAVRGYLKRGGKVLLMLDPPDKDLKSLDNLIAFAKEWGVTVGTNILIDEQSINSAAMPVVLNYPPHAVTARMNGIMTAFQLSRSVVPIEGGTDGHIAQKVLETSARSWAETDLKGLFETGKPAPNVDKGDVQGPISLAAAVTAPAPEAPPAASPDLPKPETRVLVIGDSDFASNSYIGFYGNKDLFLNISSWLAQQENLIAIRPKDPADRRITLTPDQANWVSWFTVVVFPALLFLMAIRVWWKRR